MTLVADIPLKLTSSWRYFAEVVPIPHRYGSVSGALIPYDKTGYLWCWAGHPVLGIDTIQLDAKPVNEWQWRNTVDSAGNAIALVEFGQPQDSSAVFIATGRGKLHPVTGRLIENPADLVWDILANVAGVPISEGAFTEFRAECEAQGLVCGGSIEKIDSTQTIVRAICGSVGAIFCADSPRPCRIWPGGIALPTRASIGSPEQTLSAEMRLDDVYNDLTIKFDAVSGTARQTIQLDVPASVARFGRRAQVLDAGWIASPRVAHDVAVRLLAHYSRPAWIITADGLQRRVDVGDDVTVDHPVLPMVVAASVQSRTWDIDKAMLKIILRVPVGDAP